MGHQGQANGSFRLREISPVKEANQEQRFDVGVTQFSRTGPGRGSPRKNQDDTIVF